MKKKIVFISSVIVILIGAFLYYRYSTIEKITVRGHKFKVELAISLQERERGLSGRKNICEKCAMLFIFEKQGKYSFWMKDMRFSLDIIWILDHKVVYIANDVSSDFGGNIQPPILADKVLEINGGMAERYGLKAGDEVKF